VTSFEEKQHTWDYICIMQSGQTFPFEVGDHVLANQIPNRGLVKR